MQPHQRVILFAHPRSGSSSLYEILQTHPQLRILEEPFNESFPQWSLTNKDYLSLIHDIPSLDAQLADIFSTHNGVKVLDYQLPDDLITYLLQQQDYLIIFLRRRNLLQAVVSVLVAEQTKLWKKWLMQRPLHDYYRNLQPLDIADVQRRVTELKQHLDFCESIVDQRPAGTYVKFTYEDLYFSPEPVQMEQIAAIWRFLDLPPVEPERVQYYLSPAEVKINSAETYALIPNAAEIQALCGNDWTGWLYEQRQ